MELKKVKLTELIVGREIAVGIGEDNDTTASHDLEASLFLMLKEAAKYGLKGPFILRIVGKHIQKYEWGKLLLGRFVLSSRNNKIIRSGMATLARYERCCKCNRMIKINVILNVTGLEKYAYFTLNNKWTLYCKKCLDKRNRFIWDELQKKRR